MDPLMAVATQLIARESRRVEVAASNIAHVATPGYKRQLTFQSVLAANGNTRATAAAPALGQVTDFGAGKLQHTGSPLDVAVVGPGFLQLAKDGNVAYARTASLQRTADGHLTTPQGWLLQARGGGDLIVADEDWTLARDGMLSEQGAASAAVALVEFDDPRTLHRQGNGLFLAESAAPVEARSSALHQGYLEASNVSVSSDMVQIMDAMRRVESGQKLIHAYDDMVGNALQRLGEM